MARLIYTALLSLDGYVADADGNFDWAEPDEEVHRFVNDLPFGVLLTITFLLAGFKGAQGEFGRFVALTLALGVLGGICGLVLAVIGYWARNRFIVSTASG